MTEVLRPRYPVFVPSKGRYGIGRGEVGVTVKWMLEDGLPFRLVVEPAEEHEYRKRYPNVNLLVTPRDNMRLLGVRNWIRDVSEEEGAARHWQFDDNIRHVWRWHQGRRLRCNSNFALRVAEDFSDRYTNVGITGFNYVMFGAGPAPPFRLNAHVYSATLINNAMPYRWRLIYNDDTDLCLQVLAGGLCTVQLNAFLVQKLTTMITKGGNTADLYEGDGRLRMARALERAWPGVVKVDRRFQRPQHVIDWRKFDTPLERRPDLDWDEIERTEYDLRLTRTRPMRRLRDVDITDRVPHE